MLLRQMFRIQCHCNLSTISFSSAINLLNKQLCYFVPPFTNNLICFNLQNCFQLVFILTARKTGKNTLDNLIVQLLCFLDASFQSHIVSTLGSTLQPPTSMLSFLVAFLLYNLDKDQVYGQEMKQQLRRRLSILFTYDQYFIHININQLKCYHAACPILVK